jgi:hypothetical protein
MQKPEFTMKKYILSVVCLLAALASHAQTSKQYVLDNPKCASGHYSTYPLPVGVSTAAPDGYAPFYMTHYGRHGSRYHTSNSSHDNAYDVLKAAKGAELLTPLGESVFKRVCAMRDDAAGMEGSLTFVGSAEHRGIAERMYASFPEIFAENAVIDCRSTEAPRCILSMAANNERLKELNPSLRISRTSNKANEVSMRSEKYMHENLKDMSSVKKEILAELDPSAFIGRLFKDGISAQLDKKEQLSFMRSMYALFQIAGCVAHTGVDFDDIFVPEELFILWNGNNATHYMQCANSVRHGKGVLGDAKPLLKDILERADEAMAGSGVSAHLRFGHDIGLAPLAALIDVNGLGVHTDNAVEVYKQWTEFLAMPMGANIQFVFYRNAKKDVLVKVLFNETEAQLPALKSVTGPYYRWKDVRQYFVSKLK